MNPFWLAEHLPELTRELDWAFREIGRDDLADEVWETEIFEPCPCGADSCCTFYAIERDGKWRGRVERFFDLKVEGLICVFVVNGRIAGVELFHRPDVSRQLIRLFSYGFADDDVEG